MTQIQIFTPVWSVRAKAVGRTPTQLAANTLHAAQTAALMWNECRSILEASIRCRDSAQEVSQDYNASVLRNNFRKLVFFVLICLKIGEGFAQQPLHDWTMRARAVWAIGLKFLACVKNRLGYKMTLTAIFLQFFFAYTVTIMLHFGPNYVPLASLKQNLRYIRQLPVPLGYSCSYSRHFSGSNSVTCASEN